LCRRAGLAVATIAACCGLAISSATSAAHPDPRRAVAGIASTVPAPSRRGTPPREWRATAGLAGAGSGRERSVRGGSAALPLAGKVVGIDPGHNGRNYTDPAFIDHLIWNGREEETCDTTGTETDGGYTEAQFNYNVAGYLAADLRALGARLVLTRTTNDGVGPCVTTRAEIINRARADVAIDIHADGGPDDGRGFAILEPVADGPNDRVIDASAAFGRILRERYGALTGMPVSTYDGVDGIADRDDLAGLNLTSVPKVLIECGNMRNTTDAALLVSSSFQQLAAKAFTQAITQYLTAPG
jgi:N-acetylmuramoyl-L-alanine amidase